MAAPNSRSSRHITVAFLFLNVLLLSACVSTADNQDPLENINRSVYAFNDFLDRNLVRPIAVAYTTVDRKSVV